MAYPRRGDGRRTSHRRQAVDDVLAGEQRLTAAIQRCSGLIVRERLASPTATSAGAA